MRDTLARVWDIHTASTTYERIGYGSFHWSAVATDGTRWFVTADADDSPFAVVAAYTLARRLADEDLEFVRAPVAAPDGSVVQTLGKWRLSVWPWLDGRSSTDHEHQSAADLAAVMTMVRRLHEHRGIEPDPELVEDWTVAGRGLFRPAVDAGGDGPYVQEVLRRLLAHRSRIDEMFMEYDALSAAIARNGPEFVITHGEPHAGNVVHTDAGSVLIDWDTARWAPRERDLWSLTGYRDWERAYGRDDISTETLEIYRLQWELSEMVEFVTTLLAAGVADGDTDVAIGAIRNYLPL